MVNTAASEVISRMKSLPVINNNTTALVESDRYAMVV